MDFHVTEPQCALQQRARCLAAARGPSAIRPCTEALLMPVSAGDSSISGSAWTPSAAQGSSLAAPEQALHPIGDSRQDAADLVIRR